MGSPKVSVITPVYNGAPYLGEAIQSVLDQTFDDFELILVNDASPDESAEVIKQFNDPRIKYIEHETNRGVGAARNTAIRVSAGDIIVFLDQDDIFHPQKLQTHVAFLKENPEIGVTYNPRFELLHSYSSKKAQHPSEMIRDLWRPPRKVTLADMVLGYPFGPSEMVIRRDWSFRAGLCPETSAGGEIDFDFRLWLEGCKFASVDRALTYRRLHNENPANLDKRRKDEIGTLERVFADPRCPREVLALRNMAYVNIYLDHGYIALAHEETGFGQGAIREAARLDPTILEGKPCRLVDTLTSYGVSNERLDHESLLRKVFARLPMEFAWLSGQYDWAVRRGYVMKGTRAIMWGRPEDGRRHFDRAKSLAAEVDEPFVGWLTQKLLDYAAEFGVAAAEDVLQDLTPYLKMLGGRSAVRRLTGCYSVNRAFESYRGGDYARVPGYLMRAIASNPTYLANRGVLSILLRSTIGAQYRRGDKERCQV